MKISEILVALNNEHTLKTLGKEVQISEKKLREVLNVLGCRYDNSAKLWAFEGDENILDTDIQEHVQKIATKEKQAKSSNPVKPKVQESTVMNTGLTEYEIGVLKQIVKEYESTKEANYKHQIYDDISKVPINVEAVRSAFNMSKGTTERLKKYASKRRLPLQDLVELSVINLLEQYDDGEGE